MSITTEKDLKLNIYNSTGEVISSIELPLNVFGTSCSDDLILQYIKVYTTNQRSGNANTKTRGEVAGTGKKPWKQKGTGRARVGSRRSPIWVGGGISHGPRSKDFRLDMPKKMRRLSLLSSLHNKVSESKLTILEDLNLINAKSKSFYDLITTLNLSGSVLIVSGQYSQNLINSTRNLEKVSVRMVDNLNTYDIVCSSNLILDVNSVKALEKKYENK